MYAHAKRKHILTSLDNTNKILIVYSYLIDPSMSRLITRLIVQSQLTRPIDLGATISLRTFMIGLCFVHLGSLLRHVLQPLESTDMLILDFIGRANPPPHITVALVDIIICLMQFVMLIIAFETNHYHPDAVDPLAPSEIQEATLPVARTSRVTPLPEPKPFPSHSAPVINLRLRSTFRRITNPPILTSTSETSASDPRRQSRSALAQLLLGLTPQAPTRTTGTLPLADPPPSTVPGALRDW